MSEVSGLRVLGSAPQGDMRDDDENVGDQDQNQGIGKRKRDDEVPSEKKSTQLSEYWWMIQDPLTDKPYFFNSKDKQTVWHLPAGLEGKMEEIKQTEEANQRAAKKQNTAGADSGSGSPAAGQTNGAASPIGSAGGDGVAGQVNGVKQRKKTSKQIGDSLWWIIDDPNTDKPYYYNSHSQQTAWTPPAELVAQYGTENLAAVANRTNDANKSSTTSSSAPTTTTATTSAATASTNAMAAAPVSAAGGIGLASALLRKVQNAAPAASGASGRPQAVGTAAGSAAAVRAAVAQQQQQQQQALAAQAQAVAAAASAQAQVVAHAAAQQQRAAAAAGAASSRSGRVVQERLPPGSKHIAGSVWWAVPAERNKTFYWNQDTEKSQWERPQIMNRDLQQAHAAAPTPTAVGNAGGGGPGGGAPDAAGQANGRHAKSSQQIGQSEWWLINDPATDRPYFFNTNTQKTSWQLPDELAAQYPQYARPTRRSVTAAHVAAAAVAGGNAGAAGGAGAPQANGVGAVKKKTSKQLGDTNWWEIHDPASTRPYYFNSDTSKTQWHHPFPSQQRLATAGRGQGASVPTIDAAALDPRTKWNSEVRIEELKCHPACEAKIRAKNLVAHSTTVQKQKQVWQRKYNETADKLAVVESHSMAQPSQAPQPDSLSKPLPKNIESVKTDIYKAIQTAPRQFLWNCLSTSDLRQALMLKTEYSNSPSLHTIFKFLHETPPPADEAGPSAHPTHASDKSAMGSRADPFDDRLGYVCYFNGRRFPYAPHLEQHLRDEHMSMRHACDSCEMRYCSQMGLDVHMKSHGVEKQGPPSLEKPDDDDAPMTDENSEAKTNSSSSPKASSSPTSTKKVEAAANKAAADASKPPSLSSSSSKSDTSSSSSSSSSSKKPSTSSSVSAVATPPPALENAPPASSSSSSSKSSPRLPNDSKIKAPSGKPPPSSSTVEPPSSPPSASAAVAAVASPPPSSSFPPGNNIKPPPRADGEKDSSPAPMKDDSDDDEPVTREDSAPTTTDEKKGKSTPKDGVENDGGGDANMSDS